MVTAYLILHLATLHCAWLATPQIPPLKLTMTISHKKSSLELTSLIGTWWQFGRRCNSRKLSVLTGKALYCHRNLLQCNWLVPKLWGCSLLTCSGKYLYFPQTCHLSHSSRGFTSVYGTNKSKWGSRCKIVSRKECLRLFLHLNGLLIISVVMILQEMVNIKTS